MGSDVKWCETNTQSETLAEEPDYILEPQITTIQEIAGMSQFADFEEIEIRLVLKNIYDN